MTNEEVVRAACKAIWNDGERDRISEFYAPNFKGDYPGGSWGDGGIDGVESCFDVFFEAFPDYEESIEELVADGDWVSVILRIQGTHKGTFMGIPATGKRFDIRDCTWCRVKNGKIVEQKGLSDMMTALTQLGIIELPTPA